MRHLRFILIGLALSTCLSCVKDDARDGQGDGTLGELTVMLSADSAAGAVTVKSEEEHSAEVPAELIPALDEFEVEVYKDEEGTEKLRLYRDTYANSVGKIIRLNTGKYRLLAQHGDSLGCGFGKPYFVADRSFELTPEDPKQSVSATAMLGNVMLDVAFSENVPGSYYDWYVIVRHQDHKKKSLKFMKDETRPGFIPGGSVVVEFYADLTGEGDWKYAATEPRTYSPNDYVHVSIDVEPRKSNMLFNITVNDTEETVAVPMELPSWVTPQEAPSISLAGFDENNKCRVIEGVDVGAGGSVSILARGGIAECKLSVESDLLERAGYPVGQQIDLADIDAETAQKLNEAGIEWNDDISGSRELSYINLNGVVEYLNAKSKASNQEKNLATFTLYVKDMVQKESSVTFTVVSVPINPSISIKDYNIWATRLVAPIVTVSEGANRSLFKVQFRKQGSPAWTDLNDHKLHGTGLSLRCDDIENLEPNTTYQLRVIYNNNQDVVSKALSVTTEAAQQIGNSGFEDFSAETHKFSIKGATTSQSSRAFNQPWASGETDKWWAVNSKKTLLEQVSSGNLDYKVFPTVTYSVDCAAGLKSAVIMSVQVNLDADSGNEGDVPVKAVGELFIGASDSHGEHQKEGHTFTSRPSAMSFKYKYTPVNNETFKVRIELRDKDGNIIAAQEETSRGAAGSWTECKMNLDYLDITAKASSIFVSFMSSSLKDAQAGYGTGSAVIDGTQYNARIGSVLKVDDVRLLYY